MLESEILHKKPGDILYHYTSISSLISMIDSGSIWLSNLHYMNDASEMKFAIKILKELVIKKINSHEVVENEILTQFVDWLDTFERVPHHIYAFSLTEKGNLLSQWRGYCPKNGGVSIGFRKTKLEEILSTGIELKQCIYKKDDQVSILKSKIIKFLKNLDREIKEYRI